MIFRQLSPRASIVLSFIVSKIKPLLDINNVITVCDPLCPLTQPNDDSLCSPYAPSSLRRFSSSDFNFHWSSVQMILSLSSSHSHPTFYVSQAATLQPFLVMVSSSSITTSHIVHRRQPYLCPPWPMITINARFL